MHCSGTVSETCGTPYEKPEHFLLSLMSFFVHAQPGVKFFFLNRFAQKLRMKEKKKNYILFFLAWVANTILVKTVFQPTRF